MKMKSWQRISLVAYAIIAVALIAIAPGTFGENGAFGTAWSLLPPVLAIGMALITKEVYISLFVGILSGAFLAVGGFCHPMAAIELSMGTVVEKLGDSGNVGILIFLVFLGASFPNVFDFDAKIEFTLGKGDEAETYIIDKPTIIRIPAGVSHCPLNFKEVNKPVLFLATLFTPMFGGVYDLPDGKTMEMYYNGPVPCKYNPDKKCDTCGKCLQETWEK